MSDFEILNAYVDGELTPREAARVSDAVAGDSAMARTVAKLHGMKSAVADAFEPRTVVAIIPHRRRLGRLAGLALAACLLAAIVAGVVWLSTGPAPQTGFLTAAISRHDAWLSRSPGARPVNAAGVRLVIPDLTPAGLTLAHFDPAIDFAGAKAAWLAYVGRRGCRVSLFVLPKGGSATGPGERPGTDLLLANWSAGGRRYLLVARRMNQTRFGVIAAALMAATLRSTPVAERMRLALSGARQPCLS